MKLVPRLALPVLLFLVSAVTTREASGQQDGFGDRLKVYLMTIGPGHEVYERFGHNAIWIHDGVNDVDIVYNYGTYNFDEPGFMGRFISGRPRYILAAASLERTLEVYTYYQRNLSVQELALTADEKIELAELLEQNIKPENRTYTYDYYYDNCSTRVRDILDQVLGGRLRQATVGVPAEGTLRFHTQRMVANQPFIYLGILAAMGPAVDRSLDQWGEMFLPGKLSERVAELRVIGVDNVEVPFVVREESLLRFDKFSVLPSQPDWTVPLLLIGLVLAGLIGLGVRDDRLGLFGRVLGGLWGLGSGVLGVLLLFLWLFTDHVMTRANHNVLFFSPLAFALVPALWRKSITASRLTIRAARVLSIHAGLIVLGTLLALSLSLGGQDNREIAALVVAPTLMACWLVIRVSRRPAAVVIPVR